MTTAENYCFAVPYERPFFEDEDIDLSNPLRHLLAHKIALHPNYSRINASLWKLKENSSLRLPYQHKVHYYPFVGGLAVEGKPFEIHLIEDVVVPPIKQEDFPIIGGRSTHPDLVKILMFYPKPNILLEMLIHLRSPEKIVEKDYGLVMEQGLSCFGHPGIFRKL